MTYLDHFTISLDFLDESKMDEIFEEYRSKIRWFLTYIDSITSLIKLFKLITLLEIQLLRGSNLTH